MKKIITIIILAIIVSFMGCRENLNVYVDTTSRASFYYPKMNSSSDSISRYTFLYTPENISTLEKEVKIIVHGFIGKTDREVSLKQVMLPETETQKNAVSGKHYNLDKVIVKANEPEALAKIVFNRTEDMKSISYMLCLKIVENNDFKNGYINQLTYKMIIDNKISKPYHWKYGQNFVFGKYGDEKYKFMLRVLPMINEHWWEENFSSYPPDADYCSYIGKILNDALIAENTKRKKDNQDILRETPTDEGALGVPVQFNRGIGDPYPYE